MDVSIVILLICNTMVIVNAGGGGGYDTKWSYVDNSAIGPIHWGNHYPKCKGNKQSPINVLTRDVKYSKALGKITLKNYDYQGDDVYYEMHNPNTTIEFQGKVNGTKKVMPQEVTFQGTTYRFYQFHFHWGSENTQGSEHQIDSQQFAAEMHMIHYNTKFPNVSVAAHREGDGLLVWSHMLKVDSTAKKGHQKFFDVLESNINDVTKGGAKKNVAGFSLLDMLPEDHENFYHYNGSLTTPGCFQSVKWIVNKAAISINEKQISLYRRLKNDAGEMQQTLQDNFRPIQKLNGRVVERNFVDPPPASAGVVAKPYSIVLLVVSIILTSAI